MKRKRRQRRPVAGSARPRRCYKDTVFRMLFRDKTRLLGLYNAVTGNHYQEPSALEIVTLESAVYLGVKNDIALLIDFNLYLFEHQSTMNPNMPLRFLQYVAAEYGRLTAEENLYGGKLILIPAPHFIVFYNGTAPCPERLLLKLSDAYRKQGARTEASAPLDVVQLGEVQSDATQTTVYERMPEPELELVVQVLNINAGCNEALKAQCQTLGEYMQYVSKVRSYARYLPIEAAVDRAVDECIEQGILREFLLANKAEVRFMSIFEYDEEKTRRAMRKTEYERGLTEGRAEGKAEGKAEGIAEGRAEGKAEGIVEGRIEGKAEGMAEGRAESVLILLEEMGVVPESLRKQILSQQDMKILQQWLKAAAGAESIKVFIRQVEL